ncbi:GntR family transcriptional regulator [Trinickia symbiotica]|uniref:FadR family transcriptional regulator n=1 Tax=Trinickia symbiotica TaxID=863227 RepID=A0A2N7X163_9BURK|nr:FadR/GntR family transcriptional regulator [Trinickia symbiotica]PMS35498.1 FadR family transcriptional regulator [Trinickia symbiotica]PPK45533.1 GntR family transcriptional regulator [Trinickia symbiotica]
MSSIAQTVTEAAAATIKERIHQGVYPVGSLLPAQRQLSDELQISRASLREALSTLEALGLVTIRAGKGVYVARARPAHPQRWRFADQVSLPDTYQMRYALEGFVARLAVVAIGEDDLAPLEENLDALRVALTDGEFETAARLDFDFHMRIVALAGNSAIETILRNSADIMQESQRLPFYQRELVLSTHREHAAIVEALRSRDPDRAGRAIETHIVAAAQRAGVYFPVPATPPRP